MKTNKTNKTGKRTAGRSTGTTATRKTQRRLSEDALKQVAGGVRSVDPSGQKIQGAAGHLKWNDIYLK